MIIIPRYGPNHQTNEYVSEFIVLLNMVSDHPFCVVHLVELWDTTACFSTLSCVVNNPPSIFGRRGGVFPPPGWKEGPNCFNPNPTRCGAKTWCTIKQLAYWIWPFDTSTSSNLPFSLSHCNRSYLHLHSVCHGLTAFGFHKHHPFKRRKLHPFVWGTPGWQLHICSASPVRGGRFVPAFANKCEPCKSLLWRKNQTLTATLEKWQCHIQGATTSLWPDSQAPTTSNHLIYGSTDINSDAVPIVDLWLMKMFMTKFNISPNCDVNASHVMVIMIVKARTW